MISFILARYVYYDSKVARAKRHLQTLNDPDKEPVTDFDRVQANHEARVKLYRYIYRLQDRRHLYRKLYSYFRVTSALLESFTSIIVIVILMFVSENTNPRIGPEEALSNYRSKSLIGLVEQRMAIFFGVTTLTGSGSGVNYWSEVYLVRDIVMSCSLVYSLVIILSALVKYWHQAKNVSLSVSGQLVLGIYLGLLVINKLTTVISLLRSCQLLTTTGPHMAVFYICLFIFLLILLRLALVYVYKSKFSRNWSTGDAMDQWLNVFINTYVVIPFTHYQSPVLELKRKQCLFRTDNFAQVRRRSDPNTRREEILKVLRQSQPSGDLGMTFVRIMDKRYPSSEEIKASILKMWWSNPSRKLTVDKVQEKMVDKGCKPTEDLEHDIKETLVNLEVVGLVNTPLLTPAPTRHEYFALFLLVIVENILSVVIEAYIGKPKFIGLDGEKLSYISWDIRLYCLLFASIFLIAYYCK